MRKIFEKDKNISQHIDPQILKAMGAKSVEKVRKVKC